MSANSLHTVLQHLHAGRWNAAHDLVQLEGSMLGAWLHGILHLQEGDLEDVQSLLPVSQGSRSGFGGMGCKARCAVDSLGYPQAPQRRRPPAKAAARRVGAKSGD